MLKVTPGEWIYK